MGNELVVKQDFDIMDVEKCNHLFRMAESFAGSDLVPDHYQGKPNNCFLALMRASELNTNPQYLMEHTYVYKGKLGYDGQLIHSLLLRTGLLKKRVKWEFKYFDENDLDSIKSCTCTVELKDGDILKKNLTWKTVQLNEWNNGIYSKKLQKTLPSKWDTIREQMFEYRTITMLVRAYFPDVIGGIKTLEEIKESAEVDIENEGNAKETRVPDYQIMEDKPPAKETKKAPEKEVQKTEIKKDKDLSGLKQTKPNELFEKDIKQGLKDGTVKIVEVGETIELEDSLVEDRPEKPIELTTEIVRGYIAKANSIKGIPLEVMDTIKTNVVGFVSERIGNPGEIGYGQLLSYLRVKKFLKDGQQIEMMIKSAYVNIYLRFNGFVNSFIIWRDEQKAKSLSQGQNEAPPPSDDDVQF